MEIKNLSDFKELIEASRKLGIKTLKVGDISVELSSEALFPKTPYQKKKEEELTKKAIEDATLNSVLEAERALMWSAMPAMEPSHEN